MRSWDGLDPTGWAMIGRRGHLRCSMSRCTTRAAPPRAPSRADRGDRTADARSGGVPCASEPRSERSLSELAASATAGRDDRFDFGSWWSASLVALPAPAAARCAGHIAGLCGGLRLPGAALNPSRILLPDDSTCSGRASSRASRSPRSRPALLGRSTRRSVVETSTKLSEDQLRYDRSSRARSCGRAPCWPLFLVPAMTRPLPTTRSGSSSGQPAAPRSSCSTGCSRCRCASTPRAAWATRSTASTRTARWSPS